MALFWIIDDNGTAVYEGEVVDRYWTLILVRYTFHSLADESELTSFRPLVVQ